MPGAGRLLWPFLVVIDAPCGALIALSKCCDAAFLLQRKCKSNAECQACLNILLRCSFSSAKIQHISAVCSKTEWLVKQNSERKARSGDVSCCLCVNYMGNDFCVFPMALLVKNSTFASKFQTPERAMYYVTLYHQKALHAPTRPEHPCTPCKGKSFKTPDKI